MDSLSFDKPAGVLVKTTLVDFPGIVAGSFFLKGCNLRCPYCYNKGLIDNSDTAESLNSINDLFNHLEKRQGILHGLVISGGEPLLNPFTPFIIKKAKSLGYKIKLDTNGTLPYELQAFLDSPELRPDFIAMDIKTTPEKYSTLLCNEKSKYFNNKSYFETTLKHSISILEKLPADQREFRTVLVPTLLEEKDIKLIGELLPENASWRFSQFQNINCLNPAYNQLTPYSDNQISKLIETAQTLIKDSKLR